MATGVGNEHSSCKPALRTAAGECFQLGSASANPQVLVRLGLGQDEVDHRNEGSEEAQDNRKVVEGAHQEDRLAKRVDEVDQRLGAKLRAVKWALGGDRCLSRQGRGHRDQSAHGCRRSCLQAPVGLGLHEHGCHELPACHQCHCGQADAHHKAASAAGHGDLLCKLWPITLSLIQTHVCRSEQLRFSIVSNVRMLRCKQTGLNTSMLRLVQK